MTDRIPSAWGLTPREAEVVAALVVHGTAPEVAQHLCIGVTTVRCHIQRARHKADAANATLLAVRFDRAMRGTQENQNLELQP